MKKYIGIGLLMVKKRTNKGDVELTLSQIKV